MTPARSAEESLSLMAQLLGLGARAAARFPVFTLGVAALLSLLAVSFAASKLGYRTNRIDLVSPDCDFNRLWLDYAADFGDIEDTVVVVQGSGASEVTPILGEIAKQLEHDPHFQDVLAEIDLTKVRGKGLYYAAPEQLAGLQQFVAINEPILKGQWGSIGLGSMAGLLAQRLHYEQHAPPGALPADAPSALPDAQRLAESLSGALATPPRYSSPWPSAAALSGALGKMPERFLLANQGRLGFVLLRLAKEEAGSSLIHGAEGIARLRTTLDRLQSRHPDVRIGLTGLPVMEHDEMVASQNSTMVTTVVSLIGVAILFIAGFGGVRHAMMVNLVLMFGMCWTFGYIVLSVGHLNILSVSFTVTLIGIGVDYGIHYVARYLQLRGEHEEPSVALVHASRAVGPAIMTGAVTTAVAFFMTGLTEFRGVAELGIIAGGGLLLCAVAELLVLPAALSLMDRGERGRVLPRPLPIDRWFAWILQAPGEVLLVTCVAAVALGIGVQDLWYDHNLLNMQPVGLESVEIERMLLHESDQSVWYAISLADSPEELLERKAEFEQLPTVERTEEIASLMPPDVAEKEPVIRQLAAQLAQLPEQPPTIPLEAPEALGQRLREMAAQLGPTEAGTACGAQLAQAAQFFEKASRAQCYQVLTWWQQHVAGDLLNRLQRIRLVANPEPPAWTDLPEALVHRYVSPSGQKHLLKVYGNGHLWDMAALEQFVTQVRSVDPRATGNPLQTYEATWQMKRSYEQAAIYALVVIIGVLVIDFGNLLYALLAALPLSVGMLLMFGLMGWMDLPLNPCNMIALPLILGIGVDYGVHLVHDYLHTRGPYRLSESTMVAVMIDSLTTIVGFGALMLASHRGLQSLGRVLTIGVTCCMFTSMVMLPALLALLARWREEESSDADEQAAALDSVVAFHPTAPADSAQGRDSRRRAA